MDIYYVYSYVREDGSPYYIGKGKGNRVYGHHGKIPVPKDKSKIIFVFEELSEEDSHKLECQLIKYHGRKDLNTGILRNLTDGGEGTSGIIRSGEWIQKRSGSNNHFFGKKHTTESKQKIKNARSNQIFTEETQRKKSETLKGRKLTWETNTTTPTANLKRSKSLKGRPKPIIECPHCNKIGGMPSMKQWHFDNCKRKLTCS